MTSLAAKSEQQKLKALVEQINIMKLALEVKYGPGIKSKWER